MSEQALAALLAGFGCALVALLVPVGIGRLREPVVEPDDVGDGQPAGPSFGEMAASPGLGVRAAAVAALAGAAVGYALGGVWELLVVLPLVPIGVGLAVVDWRTQLLPKQVIVPTYALVVVACLACAVITSETDGLLGAAIGWAAIGGLYFALWFAYPPGLGYGDVRLAGILGLATGYLGYQTALYGLVLGMLLGGLGGGLLTLLKVVERRNVPFGPFMLVGAWAGVVLAGVLPVS